MEETYEYKILIRRVLIEKKPFLIRSIFRPNDVEDMYFAQKYSNMSFEVKEPERFVGLMLSRGLFEKVTNKNN